jgi:hypothetical protein
MPLKLSVRSGSDTRWGTADHFKRLNACRATSSVALRKAPQHDRDRRNVGLSPRCRNPNLPERERYCLCKEVGHHSNHPACAVQHRCTRGAMIHDKAIFSVVHFEQRGAGEAALLAIFYKAASRTALAIGRVSKAYHLFLRC